MIEPALSAEEWAEELRNDMLPDVPWNFLAWFEMSHGAEVYPSPHALAALALHGQPFGFTREDVELCVWAAQKLRVLTDSPGDWVDLDALAARIAALLPPEKP